jgi:hypothetical protein
VLRAMSRTIRFGVIEVNVTMAEPAVEVIWTHSSCRSRDLHRQPGETRPPVRA